LRPLLAFVLIETMGLSMLAAGPVIGTAVSDGNFRVNNALLSGTATLFDGAVVETGQAVSRLDLKGTWMYLGSNSRARLSQKQAVLEEGMGEIGKSSNYELQARTLRIFTTTPQSIARVRLDGTTKVLVAAVNGPVRVLNRTGVLVAKVNSGATLSFDPQAGAPDAFDIRGCLLYKDGRYVVVDQNGQVVEVTGSGLSQLSGNPVRVKGKAGAGTPVAGASQIVVADSVERAGEGGCQAALQQVPGAQLAQPGAPRSSGAAPGTAEAAKAAGKAAGGSHIGLYAGVAVAGAGGAVAGIVMATRSSKSPQ
jgi:hypothetical protein